MKHNSFSRLLRVATHFFFISAALALTSNTTLANFGGGKGYAIVPNEGYGGAAIALQADGKILTGGDCYVANQYTFCITRLNADGTLDTSFTTPGNTMPGRIVLGALRSSYYTEKSKIIVRNDGKIVFGSTCRSGSSSFDPARFCVARLLPNGNLDDTFDGPGSAPGNGQFLLPVSVTSGTMNDVLRSMAFDERSGQQKMVLVGGCGNYHCVARIDDNGSYDTSFTGPGAEASAPGSEPTPSPGRDVYVHLVNAYSSFRGYGVANAVVTQPGDGKIIIVGSCYSQSWSRTLCLTKLNYDGTFDNDFNGDGTAPGVNAGRIMVNSAEYEGGVDIALQPDGDFLVLCGGYAPSGSQSERHCIYRFNSGGTVDTNFSSGLPSPAIPGRTVWGSAGRSWALAMAKAPASTVIANRVVTLGKCNFTYEVGICIGVLQNKSGGLFDGVVDPTIVGPNGNAAPNGFFRHAAWPRGGITTGVESTGIAVSDAGEMFVVSVCDGQTCVYKFQANGALATSACIADFNGDGNRSAPQDAYGVVRAMRGVTSPGLPAGLGYDIDGNGVIEPNIDGVLFARRMMGFSGNALVAGISFASSATRTLPSEIASYLDKRCGINP